MQQTHNIEKDKFELHLDEMIIKVQVCQKEKNLASCSICQMYMNCELRLDYVKSVYNSMSKGETGGFEF
ncbi:hypothetical protein [Sulfurimonas sp.]|uniref:hypothetical protein n=1 Tax=Sulfurimonas sp. TaxID=2022749 RepID=UPI0025D757CB|nr:hypothetical protein [Sulfurimonas sp.]